MKKYELFSTVEPENRLAGILDASYKASLKLQNGVPANSAKFQGIPGKSTANKPQVSENKRLRRKASGGTFAEKISPFQRSALFEWLADHTYDEVVDLVAAEPPSGFGIKVGKTTICRFYKAHFREIDAIRQAHLENRAVTMIDGPRDRDYRYVLRHSTTQLLLERLWELLSRPVESADELKKLTVIAEKMKSIDLDKDDEFESFRESILQLSMGKPRSGAPAPNQSPGATPLETPAAPDGADK